MGVRSVWCTCDGLDVSQLGGDGLLKVDKSSLLRVCRLPVLFALTYYPQVQFTSHEVCRARFSISASSRLPCT